MNEKLLSVFGSYFGAATVVWDLALNFGLYEKIPFTTSLLLIPVGLAVLGTVFHFNGGIAKALILATPFLLFPIAWFGLLVVDIPYPIVSLILVFLLLIGLACLIPRLINIFLYGLKNEFKTDLELQCKGFIFLLFTMIIGAGSGYGLRKKATCDVFYFASKSVPKERAEECKKESDMENKKTL